MNSAAGANEATEVLSSRVGPRRMYLQRFKITSNSKLNKTRRVTNPRAQPILLLPTYMYYTLLQCTDDMDIKSSTQHGVGEFHVSTTFVV